MVKARIAIVSVSSLISTAFVAGVIGCLESEANTPIPTPVPTPVPTATPKPTVTPYVSGPRPVYVVELKAWVTPSTTATPYKRPEGWVGGDSKDYPNLGSLESRLTLIPGVPPPPTITPVPTTVKESESIRARKALVLAMMNSRTATAEKEEEWEWLKESFWDRERLSTTAVMRKSEGEFIPLTDENMEKALEAQRTRVLNGRRLSDGDMRSLGGGLNDYDVPLFVHRCLTDELEYPALTAELEKQREHYGWERLDFIRDGSSWDFLYYPDSFSVRPDPILYKIQSLYRTGDDEGVIAQIGVDRFTCEPHLDAGRSIRFAFGERVIDREGNLDFKGSRDSLAIYVKFNRAGYMPLTNEEIETGVFKCRDRNQWDSMKLADHCNVKTE